MYRRCGSLRFDRARQSSHDHEAGPPRLEPLDQLVVVNPFVCADDPQSDPGRHLGEAGREEVERPTGGMRIARPQLAVPEVFALTFEAEQRVIRRPPPLDRVVPDPGLLRLSVDDQHGGVHIEDEPPRRPGLARHPAQKTVVQGAHLGQGRRGHAQQEATQGAGIRVARQPGQVLEHAVLPQQLRGLDPFEPEDHRVEQREEHLPDAVAMIALDHPHLQGHRMLEADSRQKSMEEVDSAVVRQAPGTEGHGNSPWSPRHHTEPYPWGSFRCKGPISTSWCCKGYQSAHGIRSSTPDSG